MQNINRLTSLPLENGQLVANKLPTNDASAEPDLAPYPQLPWASDVFDSLGKLPQWLSIDRPLSRLADRPGQNYLAMIGLASVIFYHVEKRVNPKVNEIWDAMIYCATCCSVGYGDIYAQTSLGKLVGSMLMTFGPAMSSQALDGPVVETAEALQGEILTTLREIHRHLRISQ